MAMRYKPKEYWDIKQKLLDVPIEQHKAFLMLTYGAMARVGEVVNGKYNHNPPISRMHIVEKLGKNDKRLLVITVLTEKTGKVRRVPLNRDKEAWLTEPILEYAAGVKGALFDYSTRWGQKIFEKYFGTQHIHQLRGWRTCHYRQGAVTGAMVDWGVIAKLGGWSNLNTPQKYYDGTIIEDYEDIL